MRYERVLILILAGFMLISCTASKQSIPETSILEGTVYAIGNDPFIKLGLQTSDGTMYILKCTKEIESDLRTKQGKIVTVHYDGMEQVPEGQALKVVKIEYQKPIHN